MTPIVRDQIAEVGGELVGSADRARVVDPARLDLENQRGELVRPGLEARAIFDGNAEQLCDHERGKGKRERRAKVTVLSRGELFEQCVGQCGHSRLEPLDRARREHSREGIAEPRVRGWVAKHHPAAQQVDDAREPGRTRLGQLLVGGNPLRAQPCVAKAVGNCGMRQQDPGSVRLAPHHRPARQEPALEPVRVAKRLGRVEVDVAHLGVRR